MQGITLVVAQGSERIKMSVVSFSGTDGLVSLSKATWTSELLNRELAAELHSSVSQVVLWSGWVRLESQPEGSVRFTILIRSTSGDGLAWRDLPSYFSILDGGYEALNAERVGALLDDLVRFSDASRAMLFSVAAEKPIECKAKMENITTTDAILLDLPTECALISTVNTTPSVVAVELFEVTYILVGFIQEQIGREAIFTLTRHVYCDQRHGGRRFLNEPVSTSLGELIEVSDFGCKLLLKQGSAFSIGQEIEIELLETGPVKARMIHVGGASGQPQCAGCAISDDPSTVNNWIRFLLLKQYPLLRFRDPGTYLDIWRFLKDTGYTSQEFAELNAMIRPKVEEEWRHVDEACPGIGATVVAMDKERIVGTIGVTQIGAVAWNTQVMATTKDPAHLPQTRALYAWRTRFILQRPTGEYNVAFFPRDKAFLDRFFRKFFLQESDRHAQDLCWEEWRLYTHILPQPCDITNVCAWSDPEHSVSTGPSQLFRVVNSNGTDASSPKCFQLFENYILRGRPFQHLCQYLTSAWLLCPPDEATLSRLRQILGVQQIFTIRTHFDLDLLHSPPSQSGRTIDDGWDVVWVCHRRALMRFHTNSLRALDIMYRKYGARSAA